MGGFENKLLHDGWDHMTINSSMIKGEIKFRVDEMDQSEVEQVTEAIKLLVGVIIFD